MRTYETFLLLGILLFLSYVTTGQDVPDDIHVGERRALARLILAAPPGGSQPAVPVPPAESNGPARDRIPIG